MSCCPTGYPGGHNVPEDVIQHRFHAGWRNFERIYRLLVDDWAVYDNTAEIPVLLEEGRNAR